MSSSFKIPHLYVSGTHYQVGFEVGKTFKERIDQYLVDFTDFKAKIIPFIETENGRKVLNDYIEIQSIKFPWYVDEIKGIADGSSLPFEWIFAINVRVELIHFCKKDECIIIEENESSCKECSSFHLVNNTNHILVHNEDASASIYKTAYLLTCKIFSSDFNGRKAPNEEFTAYSYPGQIPGNAFSYNAKGFAFGVNALYPKIISLTRTPRQFITRYMLSANNLEELEEIFINNPIAYGVSVNVACKTTNLTILKTNWNNEYKTQESLINEILSPISWSYEIAADCSDTTKNIVSKHCIIPLEVARKHNIDLNCSYFSTNYLAHFNHYDRIKIDECKVTSSRHRQAREKQLPHPTNREEILQISSDTGDCQYSIYRTPNGTDTAKTVAVGVFDMNNARLSIYFGKPCGEYELLIHLAI